MADSLGLKEGGSQLTGKRYKRYRYSLADRKVYEDTIELVEILDASVWKGVHYFIVGGNRLDTSYVSLEQLECREVLCNASEFVYYAPVDSSVNEFVDFCLERFLERLRYIESLLEDTHGHIKAFASFCQGEECS